MTLLELAQARVYLRKVGSEYHGPCPACGHGPKSTPQTSDRFSVKPDRGLFFCRTCTPEGGTAIKFLMRFEGQSCPGAHAVLGLPCESTTCPAERCPQRANAGERKAPAPKPLRPPRETVSPAFVPAIAATPQDLWRERAAKLIDESHAALLANDQQLAYLAGRGLPLEAVVRYRLGWIEKDIYRPRSAWGIEEEINTETSKPKKLWIPRGILIPTFVDDVPHRLRVRRPKDELPAGTDAYIEVKGSGNDRVVLTPQARAVVVVESDLDALLVDWCAGDLVGALPTVSASAKPKASIWPQLQKALCILVASDFESVYDEKRQRWVSAGGSAAKWWQEQFPRAKRWPVPTGKDPGEFYQQGGDVRAWIIAGLPPVFRLNVASTDVATVKPASGQELPADPTDQVEAPAPGRIYHGTTPDGCQLHIAERVEDGLRLAVNHPGEAVFLESEILAIKREGYTPEQSAPILASRRLFPFDGRPLEIRPIVGDGLAPQPQTYKPPQRRAK